MWFHDLKNRLWLFMFTYSLAATASICLDPQPKNSGADLKFFMTMGTMINFWHIIPYNCWCHSFISHTMNLGTTLASECTCFSYSPIQRICDRNGLMTCQSQQKRQWSIINKVHGKWNRWHWKSTIILTFSHSLVPITTACLVHSAENRVDLKFFSQWVPWLIYDTNGDFLP